MKKYVLAIFVVLAVFVLCGFTGTDGKVLADGTYSVDVAFEGGTGKARILSPAELVVKGGEAVVTVTWSSKNYDYMIVNGEKYLPVNTEGNSVFEIPVDSFDKPLDVIADTVAMSKPHEVEYTISFE